MPSDKNTPDSIKNPEKNEKIPPTHGNKKNTDRLAKALQTNLRRRKTATRATSSSEINTG